MTDTPEHDEPLTPRQEAAVRRALAEAGGPEPMPSEVADRLDKVIAGLAAEQAGDATTTDPVDPAARGVVVSMDPAARRRRARVRVLFAAAAAVVAVGVGASVVGGNDGGVDGIAASEQMAEDDPSRTGPEDAAGQADQDDAGEGAESMESAIDSTTTTRLRHVVTREPLREVRADQLRRDLVAVQRALLPHPATADYARTTLTAPKGFMCEQGAYGQGYLVGVEYDGKPALVAFREPMGSNQVAEVLACGTGYVLHSTTLEATG